MLALRSALMASRKGRRVQAKIPEAWRGWNRPRSKPAADLPLARKADAGHVPGP